MQKGLVEVSNQSRQNILSFMTFHIGIDTNSDIGNI